MDSFVVEVGTPAMVPVAAHRGMGAGQAPVRRDVAADALHRRSFTGRPDPRFRVEVRVGNGHDKGVARCCAGRKITPLDTRPGMFGQGRPGIGVSNLDLHLYGAAVGNASSSWLMAGMAVSSPARRKADAVGSMAYPRPGPEIAARSPVQRPGPSRRRPRPHG